MTRERDNATDIDVHEEENYFISLTDLMTGVVFIFVILLVIMATTLHLAQDKLKNEQERAVGAEKRAVEAEKRALEAEKGRWRRKRDLKVCTVR
jgi:hypothetical protein